MSPIYVRPAREQIEHDRLIRHLQTKYKKKFSDVIVNIDGQEPQTAVKIGPLTLYPDIVLMDGKKLAGLAEVETGESVNNLEAMAQWTHFALARVPFHLYVPVQGYESARRLCDSYQVKAAEIWTYRPATDGFDLVRMHADPSAANGARGGKAASVVAPAAPPKPVTPPPAPAPAPEPAKAAAKPAVKSSEAPAKAAKAKPVAKAEKAPKAPAPKAKTPPAKAKKPVKASKAARPAKPVKARKPAPAKAKKGAARKSR
ncbi:MAG TPA: hypothetical protein VHB78_08545 [Vicinamibacterales bacterium]|nr:hypothetical protein [Vicinamibacterales bacterium]